MRIYAKTMIELGKARREMEKTIKAEKPGLTPSMVRQLAKQLVMEAFKKSRVGKLEDSIKRALGGIPIE